MPYKIPKDLPQVPARWQEWTLDERIEAMRAVEGIPYDSRIAACIISLVEQPLRVPNGNCCGVMGQGEKYPWGWNQLYWQNVKPEGYVLLKERQTGRFAPFLSFRSVMDSFLFLCQVVQRREILSPQDYCKRWVGLKDADVNIYIAYRRASQKLYRYLLTKK